MKPHQKIIKYATILFVVLVIGIFIATILLYTQLKIQILSFISTYGYIALFFITYLLELLFQPIAADIPIITFILAKANVYLTVLIVLAAMYIASITNYYLGRVYGEWGLKKLTSEKQYNKWKKLYLKYGRYILLIASVSPVPYAPMCWIVGMFKMKKIEFFTYALIPRTIRYLIDAYLALLILGI